MAKMADLTMNVTPMVQHVHQHTDTSDLAYRAQAFAFALQVHAGNGIRSRVDVLIEHAAQIEDYLRNGATK